MALAAPGGKTTVAVAAAVVGLACFLAAWAARPGREGFSPGEKDDDAATIFVSVASYRDSDCLATLQSMFDNATNPARVRAGVCEQNSGAAGEVCLPAGFKWHGQVRRISLPYKEAKGPTYARYLCSTLYRDETYFCQIDSHTRFVKGWDAKAIAALRRCPSQRPVLTHYPHDWDQLGTGTTQVPVLCKCRFDDHGVPTLEAVTMEGSAEPRPTPFTSGGFLFGPGSIPREVPYDPDLPGLFQGEEILYSARLWTSGYDFFTPPRNLVFHHYYRKSAPKFWDEVSYAKDQQRTLLKVKKLLRGGLPGYSHGMGTVRSLERYNRFAGIDWAASRCSAGAKFCK